MKTCITVLLLFVLSLAVNAQSLDGNWKGKFTGPNGDMDLTFTFKVDADSLTGSVASEMGTLQLENGKVNGNNFSFDINVNGNVISNTGVLDGDTVKLSSPRRDQPMILTRVAEEANAATEEANSKIDGKWLGKVSGPQGDIDLVYTFKVDGNKITGADSSAMGSIDLTNGVVNGNDFSFDVEVQGMTISHKCKYLPDGTIDVKADVNGQEMAMKLTRAAQ